MAIPFHSPADPGGAHLDVGATVAGIVHARAQIAKWQAVEAGLMADLVEHATAQPDPSGHEIPLRDVTAQVAAATRTADRTARAQLGQAWSLVNRFPATWNALAQGRIGQAHARTILDAGAGIMDDTARAMFEERILPVAERETPGRLRGIARLAAHRAQPRSLRERHLQARETRCAWVSDEDDAMSVLSVRMPTILAHGALDRARTQAKAIAAAARAAGAASTAGADAGASAGAAAAHQEPDERTVAQVTADVIADLLLTGTPTGHGDGLDTIRAEVQITVPVLTLLGKDDTAVLAGTIPIDPDTAARLTANAPGWDRILTHPITGTVEEVDRYRPSDQMRRFLRARDQRCRFPTCNRPAARCDLDHTQDHQHGGPTARTNLAHLCEPHHIVKHATQWSVRRLEGGQLEWTSPTGHVYIDTPPATVTFTTDDQPPPF